MRPGFALARIWALLVTIGCLGAAAPTAAAQSADASRVDLELVLLADASRSIDPDEIQFQRQGYAAAIADPAVLDAIAAGYHQRIAVAYVEWGDEDSQAVVAGWSVIDGKASAEAFASRLLVEPRKANGSNAIGSALLFGKALIENNGLEGFRRVIDFSADSANSWGGPTISAARKAVLDAGITINGLAVLCRACSGPPVEYDLAQAFEETITGGPGAFVVTAESSDGFFAAVRRKLVLEISGRTPGDEAATTAADARRAAARTPLPSRRRGDSEVVNRRATR